MEGTSVGQWVGGRLSVDGLKTCRWIEGSVGKLSMVGGQLLLVGGM